MTRHVQTCRPEDLLSDAARLMRDHDCGCLPVTRGSGSELLVGMVTDRDICMAALLRGKALQELRVRDAMVREVRACNGGDEVAEAEAIMREAHLRRLPVVDRSDRLIGLLSLTDLAREAARQRDLRRPRISMTEVGDVLATICQVTPRATPEAQGPGTR